MKKRIISIIILTMVFSSFVFFANIHMVESNPIMTGSTPQVITLYFKTHGGGVGPDYGNFLRQHLARIKINLEVMVLDKPSFIAELVAFHDYDICYHDLEFNGVDPNPMEIYSQDSVLNIFGYDTTLDYDDTTLNGENEWYIQKDAIYNFTDTNERIDNLWIWEQYMMDRILPLLPTFTYEEYHAYWNNLNGFNLTEGLLKSFGKMSWTGTHLGQSNTNEIVIPDDMWVNLNPLFQYDSASKFITQACLDPLIWVDPDMQVKMHLAEDITYTDNNTLEIKCREGIKWANDPDGNFTNEFFDVNDLYFTLYVWKTLAQDKHLYSFIEDMKILDNHTLELTIDGDPNTPEYEVYNPIWKRLNLQILPEHYLNQTQEVDGITPEQSHTSWNTYAQQCFGTGPFEISSFTEGVGTNLTLNSNSWWLNSSITSDIELDWSNRFGTFSSSLDQIYIRIIPDTYTTNHLEFQVGKLDIIDATTIPDQIDLYASSSSLAIQSKMSNRIEFYGFNIREDRPYIGDRTLCNLDSTLTQGLALRKAIAYALDREEINDVIHRGNYTIIDCPIPTSMGIWCNPNIIRYNYDLDKARNFISLVKWPTTSTTPGGFKEAIIAIGVFAGAVTISGIVWVIVFSAKKRKARGLKAK